MCVAYACVSVCKWIYWSLFGDMLALDGPIVVLCIKCIIAQWLVFVGGCLWY